MPRTDTYTAEQVKNMVFSVPPKTKSQAPTLTPEKRTAVEDALSAITDLETTDGKASAV